MVLWIPYTQHSSLLKAPCVRRQRMFYKSTINASQQHMQPKWINTVTPLLHTCACCCYIQTKQHIKYPEDICNDLSFRVEFVIYWIVEIPFCMLSGSKDWKLKFKGVVYRSYRFLHRCSLYFVSPRERPWRQRVFWRKTLVIARATCVFSHAFKKEHRDWRINDASYSEYPWARSVMSRSFSGFLRRDVL